MNDTPPIRLTEAELSDLSVDERCLLLNGKITVTEARDRANLRKNPAKKTTVDERCMAIKAAEKAAKA